MARRSDSIDGERRRYLLRLPLSPAERAMIEAAADAAEVPVAEFVRDAALEAARRSE